MISEVNHLLINKNERSLLWWLRCLVPIFGRYVRRIADNWNILHVAKIACVRAKNNDLCCTWWEIRTPNASDRRGLPDGWSAQKDHINARDTTKELKRSKKYPHKISNEGIVTCAWFWPVEAAFEVWRFSCLLDWLIRYVGQDTSNLCRGFEWAECWPGDQGW